MPLHLGSQALGALALGNTTIGEGWMWDGAWRQVYSALPPLVPSGGASTATTRSVQGSIPCTFTSAYGDATVVTYNGPPNAALELPLTWVEREVEVHWGVRGLNLDSTANVVLSASGTWIDPGGNVSNGYVLPVATTNTTLSERTTTLVLPASPPANPQPVRLQISLRASTGSAVEVTPFIDVTPA